MIPCMKVSLIQYQNRQVLKNLHWHNILSPEEVPCIGDVNVDPELLNHMKDTNTPEYSDPIAPECMDDINMANNLEDTTVNIYNTFDDPTL